MQLLNEKRLWQWAMWIGLATLALLAGIVAGVQLALAFHKP